MQNLVGMVENEKVEKIGKLEEVEKLKKIEELENPEKIEKTINNNIFYIYY